MITEGALIDGRYRLDQPIGHGRAGVVWLAFDTQLHRTVCAKPMYIPDGLDPGAAGNARSIALSEGRTACRLVHNCAITVYDTVVDGAGVWQIMEYVPSRTMDEFLREHGTLTPEQAADLGAQLASALATAHATGITHGAVSPGSVLLADDGGVKLTEFGVSSPEPSAAYRAPERAGTDRPGPAADAFSLGCTLYRAVEGIPPFGVAGAAEQTPPHNAGVLTGVLLKLLEPDPQSRPALPDMIAALQAISTRADTAGVVAAADPPVVAPTERQPVSSTARREQSAHGATGAVSQQSTQPTQVAQPHGTGQAPQQHPPQQELPQPRQHERQQQVPQPSTQSRPSPQSRPAPRAPAAGIRRVRPVVALAVAFAVLVGVVFTELFVL